MTTYPKGHRIQWRPDIPPRTGSQIGTLARPWHQYHEFPCIIWDGEQEAHTWLPECVQPLEQGEAKQASGKNAWDEHKKVGAR